jgi:protein associated with RNAse G/E
VSAHAVGDVLTFRKLKYQNGNLWMMWQWDEVVWHVDRDFFVCFETPGFMYAREDATWMGTLYAIFFPFPNEPFYIYELYSAEPPYAFEGWYCNLNTPLERTADGYSYIDIDLDVYVNPDMTYRTLDEDEYRDHSTKYEYTEELRQTVERAMELVLERIQRVEFPFRPNVVNLAYGFAQLAERFGKTSLPPDSPVSLSERQS